MKNEEKLSVIIPTKDRKELLTNCLYSLSNQSRLPDEIIVIDNSPLKTAKEVTTYFKKKISIKIRYLHQPKIGSPYVRNLGIKAANYDILAFIDDDCVADKTWVEEILKSHRKYSNLVIKGKNLNGIPENLYACVEHLFTELIFELEYYKRNKIIYSCLLDTKNFSVRKYLLKKYHLFFDKLFAPFSILEDLDFARRIKEFGINIIYNPKMLVWHYGRIDLVNHFKREFNKGRAFFHFKKKWKDDDRIALLINRIYKRHPKLEYYILKKLKKKKLIEERLKKEIFRNKSRFFVLRFYFLTLLSKMVIKLGYYYEKLKQKFNYPTTTVGIKA